MKWSEIKLFVDKIKQHFYGEFDSICWLPSVRPQTDLFVKDWLGNVDPARQNRYDNFSPNLQTQFPGSWITWKFELLES